MAAVAAAGMMCGWAGAANAYDFQLTYSFETIVSPFGGVPSVTIDKSDTITASSTDAAPDYLGFYDSDIGIFFNNGSYLINGNFAALGGSVTISGISGDTSFLGDHTFGGSVYGSDAGGNYISGPIIDGTFSIRQMNAVPLPASAPLFGAALVALGIAGYGLKKRKAAPV